MDNSIFRWINRLTNRTGWAHGFFTSYAKYGIVLFAVLLVAAYLDGRQHDDLRAVAGSVWAAGAALAALGIGQLIGGAIGRARPYDAMTGVHLLVDKTTDFSFPSDHATAAGAVAVGLLLTNRRLGIVAAVLAIVMAFTRVYVGAHYPGDVIAGLALGGAVAAAGMVLVVPLLARLAERLSRTRFRVLLLAHPA
ncbi:MAG TPA: phosphatase PAP2 family protein [Ilumatobacteraceae bacterium]|nr:phosphatase PAP2 family protein [Ilumatobacteraceae bacterium]HRB02368.1 phosphatase PAP2 family protein [Ilumatobacteraceae bacterium]